MHKIDDKIRAVILVVVILVAMALCGVRLMRLQIVQGEEYLALSKTGTYGKQTIEAARGEIVDINGVEIVKNKVGFNVIIEKAFFPSDLQEGNAIILRLVKILEADGLTWEESIPISDSAPYTYHEGSERAISIMLDEEHLRLNSYATAEDCIAALIEKYEISDSYTEQEKRIIAGIRYEMLLRSFSVSNRYTFAKDIPISTVSDIKELSYMLDGVDIAEEAIREYAQSDILSHSIGTVGPIYAEEYAELKNKGYSLNDELGKSGIEKYMESYLRGQDGIRTTNISGGVVTSVTDTVEAVPGNTVMLTVDSEFQRNVQDILADHIAWLNEYSTEDRGKNCYAGSIVVLDAKTGAVRAMANYPTYDIYDYINNYSEVAARENYPLINRATDGLYRPGSTFKTITATAALNEGVITPSDRVSCGGVYTFYSDIRPGCTGMHGAIPVDYALKVSCNIFFYDVGRRLGIDAIDSYAAKFGLGEDLGFETGGSKGFVSSPDVVEGFGQDWTPGLVLQTAIGQSETAVTPLQLAVQAMTLANDGVRYKPYIIDSVYDYNRTTLVEKTEPEIVSTIDLNYDYVFDTVEDGMIQAAEYGMGVFNYYYDDYLLMTLPRDAAIKTGTPQKTKEITSSAAICYYPADDPEIAISCFLEEGEYSKYMLRQVIDAYYHYGIYSPDYVPPVLDEFGNEIIPEETTAQNEEGSTPPEETAALPENREE